MNDSARVSLIGAGPGDPGLFTIKGKECMERADVVIYDYLANGRLLEYASPDAEMIFVGKKGFSEHVTQEEINAIIVEKARQPGVRHVARLKGGDPFVFGRGGEEALALAAEGISFEVVPGVTSGVAAPAYAGIPVTHRKVASSMALITGHEDPTKAESAIDWEHLAHGVDTLCFYMGIKALPMITRRLMDAGRSPDTPVALVRWGTTPSQETLVSTLEDVAEDARRAEFQAPAIIVVGEVVGLREKISWFEASRPLLGTTVAVTRARTQASSLSAALDELGARTVEFPTIRIAEPASYCALDDAIENIGDYNWLVFTSVNGVESFFGRLRQAGLDARALGCASVAAIGPATAARLQTYGIMPDVVPEEYRAEGVIEAMLAAGLDPEANILIPRAKVAREVLPDELRSFGAQVDVVEAYETVIDGGDRTAELVALLKDGEIDIITFASSSTVENFKRLLDEAVGAAEAADLLASVKLASIGPITTATAERLGMPIAIEAQEYTIDGLVQAIQRACTPGIGE